MIVKMSSRTSAIVFQFSIEMCSIPEVLMEVTVAALLYCVKAKEFLHS